MAHSKEFVDAVIVSSLIIISLLLQIAARKGVFDPKED
jgi:hypothetical protein